MRLAQHDTSDDNDGATAAKAAKFFPFLSLPITSSLLIMLIFPFLGSYFAGTCRSRVAGQTRRYRLNHRCLGDQFRPTMCAGWLAYIKNAYPDGVAFVTQSVGQGTLVVNDED